MKTNDAISVLTVKFRTCVVRFSHQSYPDSSHTGFRVDDSKACHWTVAENLLLSLVVYEARIPQSAELTW